MHKRKAAVSRGIWTILSRWAAEFCELAHGIWQNLPRKTVDPTSDFFRQAISREPEYIRN